MAQVDTQPATDLAVQPSPVLLEAVLKVEQVVARLQNLQTTISGIHLSPVNPKQTRSSRVNASNSRALNSKFCGTGKGDAGLTPRRGELGRNSSRDYKADSKLQSGYPLKSKDEWKQWSSPANQVHDVISEILMASQFAKQIATLVADALCEVPQKTREPTDQVQEPKKRVCQDGKRKDIAFPSKAQVQKTMTAKAPSSKSVNKFKVAFPSDSTVKLVPSAKLSRPKDPPSKNAPASLHKRRISRGSWSNSSSPDSLSPRSPRLVVRSPENKRKTRKLFSSPESSFRKSDDADDELSGPRRHSMNVTEIKVPAKPWKLTPTKGVLFSNPVYLSNCTKSSAGRPSPEKIVPTTGRRRSWLTHQFPKSPEVIRESTKYRSPASANPLSSSIFKTTFKREGATRAALKLDLAPGSSKREQNARKTVLAPPSRYVEMVPLDETHNSSTVTMLDVLKVRSPPRRSVESPAMSAQTSRRLMPLDANKGFKDRAAVMGATNEISEDFQCRDSHSHTKSSVNVTVESHANGHTKPMAHPKQGGSFDKSDKENAPVPSCASAAIFLRIHSSAHTLNRTLSRKYSGVSLLKRAKGWMSSQAVRHDRVLEHER